MVGYSTLERQTLKAVEVTWHVICVCTNLKSQPYEWKPDRDVKPNPEPPRVSGATEIVSKGPGKKKDPGEESSEESDEQLNKIVGDFLGRMKEQGQSIPTSPEEAAENAALRKAAEEGEKQWKNPMPEP
jgi:hypothetical protein